MHIHKYTCTAPPLSLHTHTHTHASILTNKHIVLLPSTPPSKLQSAHTHTNTHVLPPPPTQINATLRPWDSTLYCKERDLKGDMEISAAGIKGAARARARDQHQTRRRRRSGIGKKLSPSESVDVFRRYMDRCFSSI